MTVGTDSWVTVAEANTYLADKYGASTWSALTDAIKQDLLITAFRAIYFSGDYNIPKTSTNEFVKNAQIETAWYLYNFNTEIEKRSALQEQGVLSFSLSKFSETYKGNYSLIAPIAKKMLMSFESWDVFGTFDREVD